jgi:hypothetical protein
MPKPTPTIRQLTQDFAIATLDTTKEFDDTTFVDRNVALVDQLCANLEGMMQERAQVAKTEHHDLLADYLLNGLGLEYLRPQLDRFRQIINLEADG